jgi:hypothetical protein
MALRKFKCNKCQTEWSKLMTGTGSDCPNCGLSAVALLPVEISSTVYEMRDKYRGSQVKKNQEQKMRKRMNDHHDRYELAEKIDKYGLEDAKRYGWLKRQKKV